MQLEKQVTSLELSKRLKELGVKQESLYRWSVKGKHFCADEEIPEATPFLTQEKPPYDFPYKEIAPAFTVAELGEMLPKQVAYSGIRANGGWMDYMKHDTGFSFTYLYVHTVAADTEADARAKMLIYLLENNLITL